MMSFSERFYFRVIIFNLNLKLNLTAVCSIYSFYKDYLPYLHLFCNISLKNKNFYKLFLMSKDLLIYLSGSYRSIFFKKSKFNNLRLFYNNKVIAAYLPLHFIFLDNFIYKFLPEMRSKDLSFNFSLIQGSHLLFSFKDIYDLDFFNKLQAYHDYYKWNNTITYLIKKPFFLQTQTTKMLSFLLYSELKLNL